MRDPEFAGGDYYAGDGPRNGLAVARMVGHITYLSEQSMEERFGRSLQHGGARPHGRFEIDFAIESYLHHQGDGFAERFDANTYLYYTRVLDTFDPFPDELAAVPALAATPHALPRAQLLVGLALRHPPLRAHRARARAERRAACARARSRRRTGTTRSCSTSPSTCRAVQEFVRAQA